jgi:hypothetical protein
MIDILEKLDYIVKYKVLNIVEYKRKIMLLNGIKEEVNFNYPRKNKKIK